MKKGKQLQNTQDLIKQISILKNQTRSVLEHISEKI